MRSSNGQYYTRLDHLRGLAALMVFVWHFLHHREHIAFAAVPNFLLFSLFEEGHTGVSLFMVLSGYLFSKLVGEKSVDYGAFLWNRAVRLAPLLVAVFAIVGYTEYSSRPSHFFKTIISGFVNPVWPNGGWSITIELHFYLLFPFLIVLIRRFESSSLLVLVAGAILIRAGLYARGGDIAFLGYWTLVGRIDQFLLGIFAERVYRGENIRVNGAVAGMIGTGYLLFWHYFNVLGGFYQAPKGLWVIIPTVEGIAYATLCAWWDQALVSIPGGVDSFLAWIGERSYSIYLLHFFFYGAFSDVAFEVTAGRPLLFAASALVAFALVTVIASPCYEYYEKRFFRYRVQYLTD